MFETPKSLMRFIYRAYPTRTQFKRSVHSVAALFHEVPTHVFLFRWVQISLDCCPRSAQQLFVDVTWNLASALDGFHQGLNLGLFEPRRNLACHGP
jgi:hypothetical protein